MRLLLISSSVVHGYGYLDHSEAALRQHLSGLSSLAFVPFAGGDHDVYTSLVRKRLATMGIAVNQVREKSDVESAEAIFIGGGNTFRLLKTLYDRDLLEVIRQRVRSGMPYVGSSAGTNVATPSIKTTNDMPIVFPPSFDALGLVPFQINPHYLDPDPNSTHQGETRETRINEFHEENLTPVAGLREGSMLHVVDTAITLLGDRPLRLFRKGLAPVELQPGAIEIG